MVDKNRVVIPSNHQDEGDWSENFEVKKGFQEGPYGPTTCGRHATAFNNDTYTGLLGVHVRVRASRSVVGKEAIINGSGVLWISLTAKSHSNPLA